MQVKDFSVNITSEKPEALIAFYGDVVGLEKHTDMGDGAFKAGSGSFFVDGHGDISGPTKEPARALINFVVEDVAGEEERLKAAGVSFIRSQGTEFWGGIISTFLDPDGNYVQLMQFPSGE